MAPRRRRWILTVAGEHRRTRRLRARTLACAATFAGALAAAGVAEAAEHRFVSCGAPFDEVEVAADSAADRNDVCAGAGDALSFFRARAALTARPRVRIIVTSNLPPPTSASAAGCFVEKTRESYLLPYALFRRNETWFRIPVERAMYRSAAAHEAAHALLACHYAADAASIRAKEYVAYVAMFETMKAPLRARILDAYPEPAFASYDRLTMLLYLFDPMRFGVQSWRHYSRPENGQAFLGQVLAGRELRE